jgi:tetratricopeptide (TPR) repeat protein
LTQCRAIVDYLRLAFWPDRLTFDYGTALVRLPSEVAGQILLLALLLVLGGVAWRRRPAVGFLTLAFFFLLVPSSSVVPIVTEPVAEHRMYLPLAALALLVVGGVFSVLSRLPGPWSRRVPAALGAVAALGLGAATISRNRDYRSALSLWTDTVAKAPGNPRGHNNLAEAYGAAGEPAKAADEFAAAVRVDPDYAPAQYNLGVTLLDSGHPQEAIPHLTKALAAPRHRAEAHLFLAEAFERARRYAEAAAQYRESLRLAPESAEAAFGLGNCLAAQGDYAGAVEPLREAAARSPGGVLVRNNLANALLLSGRVEEAIAEYREALKRDPGNVAIRENLERALAQFRAGGRP